MNRSKCAAAIAATNEASPLVAKQGQSSNAPRKLDHKSTQVGIKSFPLEKRWSRVAGSRTK